MTPDAFGGPTGDPPVSSAAFVDEALLVACLALLFVTRVSTAAPALERAAEAAERFAPETQWVAGTGVALDFTCRGRREVAVLGFGRPGAPRRRLDRRRSSSPYSPKD